MQNRWHFIGLKLTISLNKFTFWLIPNNHKQNVYKVVKIKELEEIYLDAWWKT